MSIERFRLSTPGRIACVVLLFHAIWIGAYLLGSGHDIRDFIKIGPRFERSSHASSVIHYDRAYGYITGRAQDGNQNGYDGQFAYYIALDPAHAHSYIVHPDSASYRYERILYPMLARFTALEHPSAIPWALLIINWLACGVGVFALAAWLRRKRSSPWWAAVYGLYPGMLIALQFDLTEPLAYCLVAVAIYLFDFGGRRGVLASGAVFALAALTREITLLYPLLFGLSILVGRPNAATRPHGSGRARQAAGFLALALTPFAAWIAVDFSWLGAPHTASILDPVPFAGIFADPLRVTRQPLELVFVGLPALLVCAAALRGLRRGPGQLERLCLLANALMVVVFSGGAVWASYTSIGRVAIGIVLAAVICAPYLPMAFSARRATGGVGAALRPRAATAVTAGALLWMAMLPGALYYGFSQKRVAEPPGTIALGHVEGMTTG